MSNRKPPRPRWHQGQRESLPGFLTPGQQLGAGFTFGRQDEGFLFRRRVPFPGALVAFFERRNVGLDAAVQMVEKTDPRGSRD
jgi:hypothetical protein